MPGHAGVVLQNVCTNPYIPCQQQCSEARRNLQPGLARVVSEVANVQYASSNSELLRATGFTTSPVSGVSTLLYLCSFIPQSVSRQVHSLFQGEFSTECDLLVPLSFEYPLLIPVMIITTRNEFCSGRCFRVLQQLEVRNYSLSSSSPKKTHY